MAKLGPPQNGQFSPFTQMEESLAALSQPVPTPVHTPAAVGGRQPQPAPRAVLAPPAPERREAPPQPRPAPRIQQAPVVEPKPVPVQEQDAVPLSPSLLTMKRFKVSPEESGQMEQAALRLAVKLGVKIDFSKITRALWQVYLKHEEDVLRNATVGMTRDRPANDDTVGLAELDEQLAQIVADGFMVAGRRPANRG